MCCLFSSLEITLWESFWWTDRENFNFIKWKMYVYLKWHHLHLSISKCHQVCFLKDRGVRTYTHVMSWLVCANSISRIRKKLAVTQGCHPGKEFGGWGVGQEGVLLLNSLLYLLNWEPRETAIYSQTKRLHLWAKGWDDCSCVCFFHEPRRWEWVSDQAGHLWERALPQHPRQLHMRVQRRLHRQPYSGRVPWWVRTTGRLSQPRPPRWEACHLDVWCEIMEIVKTWGRFLFWKWLNVIVLGAQHHPTAEFFLC